MNPQEIGRGAAMVDSVLGGRCSCGSATKHLCKTNSRTDGGSFERNHLDATEVALVGQRVRGFFAIVGGSAVALAAAVVVLTSAAPERPINVCDLAPSIEGCTPPLNGGNYHSNTVAPPSVIPQDTVNALPNH